MQRQTQPRLVIIFGPPLSGKTTLAWELARSLPGKSAVIGVQSLSRDWIAVTAEDRRGELDMAHTQLRLLAANYLKMGYNLVIEGEFLYQDGEELLDFQNDVDQLVQLMRHLAPDALTVQLSANRAVLAERAAAEGRDADLAAAQRFGEAYKARYGLGFLALDGGLVKPGELANRIRELIGF